MSTILCDHVTSFIILRWSRFSTVCISTLFFQSTSRGCWSVTIAITWFDWKVWFFRKKTVNCNLKLLQPCLEIFLWLVQFSFSGETAHYSTGRFPYYLTFSGVCPLITRPMNVKFNRLKNLQVDWTFNEKWMSAERKEAQERKRGERSRWRSGFMWWGREGTVWGNNQNGCIYSSIKLTNLSEIASINLPVTITLNCNDQLKSSSYVSKSVFYPPCL